MTPAAGKLMSTVSDPSVSVESDETTYG
ncbi:hypothetical protein JMJ77_0001777 [Colletotrichum scovillei]|uniref:Uncharacterized protein n=1 Tax=Colletotrichum scovillei TaxID=1209932 RepID=A0A9P7R6N9_9PEZI|nr:hypothetical protein JMJ77_0001777 [Colletotrichum scovillei]KAG7070186.1 hypothetical protein JMJ76_0001442 [Colletotrichum scovillei]KAG7078437.1 hypothetical protein JMJ78_0002108 [Colletotrichum scovillei]